MYLQGEALRYGSERSRRGQAPARRERPAEKAGGGSQLGQGHVSGVNYSFRSVVLNAGRGQGEFQWKAA